MRKKYRMHWKDREGEEIIDDVWLEEIEEEKKIKLEDTGSPCVTYRHGGGIEDCPAAECDGEECKCEHEVKNTDCICKHCGACMHPDCKPEGRENCFPKETVSSKKEHTETLEEKLYVANQGYRVTRCAAEQLAQIAKSHYQKNPEEIFEDCENIFIALCNLNRMVSIDEVLRVFDEHFSRDEHELERKAIEQLGEK